MRKSKLLIPIAVAGLLCAGAAGLQAQPYKLNVELSAKFQKLSDQRVGTSHTVIWTTRTMRVTNKDILSLLEIAYGADFTGDTLALSSSGDFEVLDGTNVVQNVSGFLSNLFNNESDSVSNETLNDNSGSNSGTDFFTASFTYSDPDPAHTNSFTFGGSEASHFTFNGHNGHFTESFILTGAGAGDIESILQGKVPGTIILKGSISGHRSGID